MASALNQQIKNGESKTELNIHESEQGNDTTRFSPIFCNYQVSIEINNQNSGLQDLKGEAGTNKGDANRKQMVLEPPQYQNRTQSELNQPKILIKLDLEIG